MSDFRYYDQEHFSNETRVRRLKIKKARRGRLFVSLLLLLAIVSGGAYAAFSYGGPLWGVIANRYFSERINSASSTELPQPKDQQWLNVMLVGVDQRDNEPSRSDTLMVAMLNLKAKTVQVISLPRDTRVKIEGVEHKTKINHAHSIGGTDLTRKTVEKVLGIPIHNYVETNFDGFKNIIDDLGGVTMDVEKRMYYPAEGINLRKGVQHLDGEKALSYVRFRSDGKGDLPRIERQHKFLKNLSEQVLQPETLFKLPKIADELHSNIDTDMSVQDLIVLASVFKDVKPENVRFTDIPGSPKYLNGASYYVIDEEKLQTFMEAVLSGKDPEAEAALSNEDKASEDKE